MRYFLSILGLIIFVEVGLAETFRGPVVTIDDGDTFFVRHNGSDIEIRFCGIDAPPRSRDGPGRASLMFLMKMTATLEVRCLQVGDGTPCDGKSPRASRNRPVAQCFLGEKDIAMEMVCAGYAVDWPKFSGGHYDKSKCPPKSPPAQ